MIYDSNSQSYDEYLTTAVSNQSNTCVTAPSTGIQYNYYGNSVIDPFSNAFICGNNPSSKPTINT